MAENRLKVEGLMGEKLTAVEVGYYNDSEPDKSKDIEKILFGFGNKALMVTTLINTDEVKIELLSNKFITTTTDTPNPLRHYIGRKLGFVWQGTHLGFEDYLDMCILSFTDLHPDILILCESSELLVFETKQLKL